MRLRVGKLGPPACATSWRSRDRPVTYPPRAGSCTSSSSARRARPCRSRTACARRSSVSSSPASRRPRRCSSAIAQAAAAVAWRRPPSLRSR